MGINLKHSLKGFSPGKLVIIGLGLLTGIILLCTGNTISDNTKKETYDNDGIYYSEILEQKVESFLMTVDGIKDADVFITVDGSKEYEYAKKGGDENYTVDFLIINNGNGEEAAIIKEIYPQIRGIAVSCTNGNKASVKEKVTTLLSSALGIPVNKIKVVGN